jgi:glutathione synthase/RimK-type ligase-like ATP-grasp enzyme
MIDVKLIVGASSIEHIINGHRHFNPERYGAFVQTFGEGNFGLVSSPSIEEELETGKPANVVTLNKNLELLSTENSGIECQLLLASTFENKDGSKITRQDLEKQMNYLEIQRVLGNIGNLINSREGTLNEDKLTSAQLLANNGFKVPKTYHFTTIKQAKEFIKENENISYIVKHRFGSAGQEVSKINLNNIGSLPKDISNYILQEELDIVDERRIIVCGEEVLGARNLIDRTRPWENKKSSKRKHELIPHTPTSEEHYNSLEIFKLLKADLGCVDWVSVKNGDLYFLELNGVGTGYGEAGAAYNLNLTVAQKLKEKFL